MSTIRADPASLRWAECPGYPRRPVIRRLSHALPSGPAVCMIAMVLIGAPIVALLVVSCDWLGSTLLDSGGAVG